MTVKAKFWSYFRDLTECHETTLELAEGTTLGEFHTKVLEQFPKLAKIDQNFPNLLNFQNLPNALTFQVARHAVWKRCEQDNTSTVPPECKKYTLYDF